MRKKIVVLISIVAVAMGVSFFAAPLVSQAVIITSVSVSTPGVPGTPFALWTFPVNLASVGNTLVLAQTSGFNFDTTDCATLGGCPTNPTVTVNAQVFTDTTKVLTVANADPLTIQFNEAQPYKSLGFSAAGDFQVLVAYADNIHTNACGTGSGSGLPGGLTGLTPFCLPSPFNGAPGTTAATFFQGSGTGLPGGFTTTNPNHCGSAGASANTCWDSGVIQIVATSAVPEPSALLLLGTGMVGFAVWRGRQRKKNA